MKSIFMPFLTRLTIAMGVLVAAFAFQTSIASAQVCKGLSKSVCDGNNSCSYVKGFTRTDGAKVKPFCRSKPGKKSSTKASTKKKTTRSTTSRTKKTSAKTSTKRAKKPALKTKKTTKSKTAKPAKKTVKAKTTTKKKPRTKAKTKAKKKKINVGS